MKLIITMFLFFLISGCQSITYSIVDPDYTSYDNADDLFSDIHGVFTPVGFGVKESRFGYYSESTASGPQYYYLKHLQKFCKNKNNGKLAKFMEGPEIPGNPRHINLTTGIYACEDDYKTYWLAEIIAALEMNNGYVGISARNVSFDELKERQAKNSLRVEKALDQFEEEMRARDRMKEAFGRRAIRAKTVGQEVCSADNRIGWVERVEGDKLQIRVDRVASDLHDYAMFDDRFFTFSYHSIGRLIWDNSKNWAECYLSR